MILSVFIIFALAVCATSSKKQAAQSQPIVSEKSTKTYQQESYPRDYDYDDTWSTDSHVYNATPHEALNNVSPNDVYAGRKEEILQRRKKRLTLERRKKYNLEGNANKNNDLGPVSSRKLK